MFSVVTSVLNEPQQVIDINNSKIEVQSYQLWLTNKKEKVNNYRQTVMYILF